MKKTIFLLVSMVSLGIASAQETPPQPPPTPAAPAGETKLENDDKNHIDATVDVPLDPATTEKNNYSVVNSGNPRKDELTTKDHVKSTPTPAIVKDKKQVPVKKNKKKKTVKRQ